MVIIFFNAVHFTSGNEPFEYSAGFAKQIQMKLIKIFCYEQSAYFWREIKIIWMRLQTWNERDLWKTRTIKEIHFQQHLTLEIEITTNQRN